MEFPDLGAHCHVKTCNRLDFLPIKCDACSYIFCNNHVHYTKHDCEKAYEKDVQVPVCPLCNKPVPTKRGQLPDLEVEQHILKDCIADTSLNKPKAYSNRCSVRGCKQKEVIPITCSVCNVNYCLKHRHPSDHPCRESNGRLEAGVDVLPKAARHAQAQNVNHPLNSSSSSSYGRRLEEMNEDEALAYAIRQSLMEDDSSSPAQNCKVLQETEDRLLAEALVASEKGAASKQLKDRRDKNCTIS